MKKILIFMILLVTIPLLSLPSSTKAESVSGNFDKAKVMMLDNYKTLTTESCGAISVNFINKLSIQGVKSRLLQLYVNPKDGYTTHVAVEVWVTEWNKWVYMDPTFNGYYVYIDSGNVLSAYELREIVKNNEVSLIKFVRNGFLLPKYQIETYYLNPLYLLKGLMYRPELNSGKAFVIQDEWAPYFNKSGTVFSGYKELTPIKGPNEIDEYLKWGIDRGNYETAPIESWSIYNSATLSVVGEWTEVVATNGGIKTKVKVNPGSMYMFTVPVKVSTGKLTISMQDSATKTFDQVLPNEIEGNYVSILFRAKDEYITIYIYQDTPVNFKLNLTQAKLTAIKNDYSQLVQVINTP